jgi:hypothetical protein
VDGTGSNSVQRRTLVMRRQRCLLRKDTIFPSTAEIAQCQGVGFLLRKITNSLDIIHRPNLIETTFQRLESVPVLG